jgi:hypothetical protein
MVALADMTIALELLATLEVAAASGCVVRGDEIFVIGDDDCELHRYDLAGRPRGRSRLFADELPVDAGARKAAKPDLEALALLPDGTLLALGSGSTERRRRAAHVDGAVARTVDLSPLYRVLGERFAQLNIEGACVVDDALVLGQRGNGRSRETALIRLALTDVMHDLARGLLGPHAVRDIQPLTLGALEGVPLALTDLCRGADGRLWLSAAAEATDDPYLDGPTTGSVIAALHGDQVTRLWRLAPTAKIEGLAQADDGSFRLVADADDPAARAPLFRAACP